MQVLNKGLDMRYHAFSLRLTIAEFQILNTKKSETSEHQHGVYTCGHGRLYLKLLKMKYDGIVHMSIAIGAYNKVS